MFKNKPLLNNIFTKSNQEVNYIIFTHDDKTWILPTTGLKTALEMYQPSTLKGKLLKKLVYRCHRIQTIAAKIGVAHEKLSVSKDVLDYISEAIGTNNFYIAGYMGDTSSRQNNKATLQIYDDNHIIAYAKVTKDEEVAKTFVHEVEVLKYLEEKEIKNVPKILGTGCVDGMDIFIQSTDKPLYQKVKLKFAEKQIAFIDKIVQSTKEKLTYEETDFYASVQYLKSKLDDFSDKEKSTLKQSITKIEEKLTEKPQVYAFLHGDYTPWNVYYTNGELNAFDFEYCSHTMPCYMDVFHYLTQMCFLGFQEEIGKTIHIYKNSRKLLEQYICDPDFTYLCYLIFIVSFYKKRTEKDSETINEKYIKWIGIMDYLNGKIK